jgi:hypothetical protein
VNLTLFYACNLFLADAFPMRYKFGRSASHGDDKGDAAEPVGVPGLIQARSLYSF